MIELTTGAVFLISSLYGSGQAQSQITAVTSSNTIENQIFTTVILTDAKAVEKYLREAYVNEPLLIDIARCESSFRQYDKDGQVMRGKVDNADVGVMQINERYHADKAVELGHNLYTIEGNIAYAKYLYGKYGSKPWVASSPCWSKAHDLAMK